MPSRRHAALAALALALSACEHTMSLAERAKAVQVVSGGVNEWAAAYSNRSAEALATLYHQGRELSVSWPDGKHTAGWREESAAQREFLGGAELVNLTVRDISVDVLSPTIAVAAFAMRLDVMSGGKRSSCGGPGTSVWMVDAGGKWRIRAHQTACAISR